MQRAVLRSHGSRRRQRGRRPSASCCCFETRWTSPIIHRRTAKISCRAHSSVRQLGRPFRTTYLHHRLGSGVRTGVLTSCYKTFRLHNRVQSSGRFRVQNWHTTITRTAVNYEDARRNIKGGDIGGRYTGECVGLCLSGPTSESSWPSRQPTS